MDIEKKKKIFLSSQFWALPEHGYRAEVKHRLESQEGSDCATEWSWGSAPCKGKLMTMGGQGLPSMAQKAEYLSSIPYLEVTHPLFYIYFFFFFFVFLSFLGLYRQHMEVPRLGG